MLIDKDKFPDEVPNALRDMTPAEVVALGRGKNPFPYNVELKYAKYGWRIMTPDVLDGVFPEWAAWLDSQEDEEYHTVDMVLDRTANWIPKVVAMRADTAVKISRHVFPETWKELEDAVDIYEEENSTREPA